jgi:hypothetical protein
MTILSLMSVRFVSVALMCGLVVYTVWLLRSERLSAHIAVRWVLAECAAIAAFLLWQWLPLFRYTSAIGDRELLMVLAVIFFVLVTFLMLDSLVRISTQNVQIKRLAQELALLREAVESGQPLAENPADPSQLPPRLHELTRLDALAQPDGTIVMPIFMEVGLSVWLLVCVAVFVWQLQPSFPAAFSRLLTAQYLK